MRTLFFRFSFFAVAVFIVTVSGSWKSAAYSSSVAKTVTGERSTFWTVSKAAGIEEWRFTSDSTIRKVKTVADVTEDSRFDCRGLAWCSVFGDKPSLCLLERDSRRRNGSGFFQPVPFSAGIRKQFNDAEFIVNSGGYGKYIYAQDYSTSGSKRSAILFWDNGQLERIYQLPELSSFGVADIAVDSVGNAWVIIRRYSEEKNQGEFFLRGFSPDGELVASVPVADYSEEHGYGFMLIAGKFYVAFGSSNKRYPSQLLALNYSNNEMQPGKAIAFFNDAHDLASKNPGVPDIPLLNRKDCNNQPIKLK